MTSSHNEHVGKLPPDLLSSHILSHLGAQRDDVLIPPHVGLDTGVVALGADRVLVSTSDPIAAIERLGMETSAWLSVQLVASDLTTSGLPPMYAIPTLAFPPHITDDDIRRYWHAMHTALAELGVAVITGHTGRYDGMAGPIVGSLAMLAVGEQARLVSPQTMAQPGDRLLITKGIALSAVGYFSHLFPNFLRQHCGKARLARAQAMLWQLSTVRDALTAVRVGIGDAGVSALHDATEGGVLGGIAELALGAGVGVRVEKDALPLSEEAACICRAFNLDPTVTLSEGTLILAVRPHQGAAVRQALADEGIAVFEVGELRPLEEGLQLEEKGDVRPFAPPSEDPYWRAYAWAMENGLT
nr:AIR synthase family protein [Ardenticatena sp.]